MINAMNLAKVAEKLQTLCLLKILDKDFDSAAKCDAGAQLFSRISEENS